MTKHAPACLPPDPAMRQRILVENPHRLYGFTP